MLVHIFTLRPLFLFHNSVDVRESLYISLQLHAVQLTLIHIQSKLRHKQGHLSSCFLFAMKAHNECPQRAQLFPVQIVPFFVLTRPWVSKAAGVWGLFKWKEHLFSPIFRWLSIRFASLIPGECWDENVSNGLKLMLASLILQIYSTLQRFLVFLFFFSNPPRPD